MPHEQPLDDLGERAAASTSAPASRSGAPDAPPMAACAREILSLFGAPWEFREWHSGSGRPP
jgi:hypothetical protein